LEGRVRLGYTFLHDKKGGTEALLKKKFKNIFEKICFVLKNFLSLSIQI